MPLGSCTQNISELVGSAKGFGGLYIKLSMSHRCACRRLYTERFRVGKICAVLLWSVECAVIAVPIGSCAHSLLRVARISGSVVGSF